MINLHETLGIERTKKSASTNTPTSQSGIIKRELNELVHNYLLETYPNLYVNLDTTTIIKQDKDGNVDALSDVSGYHLLVPIDDKVKIQNGKNELVLANAMRVSDPQIYLKGSKNHVVEFVKIGGSTRLWNKKDGKFSETKATK